MLIEAAKGGHAAVVNLLLDFSQNAASVADELGQTSPQFALDFHQTQVCSAHLIFYVIPGERYL